MNKKKHVLLVVQNSYYPLDKRVVKEAESLNKNGYKVSVISPANDKYPEKRVKINDVDVYRYKNYEASGGMKGYILEYGNAIIKIFILALIIFFKKPFKSIHVANPPDFFWPMGLFFKLFGVKFIFDQHDIAPYMYLVNENKDKNKIYKFLELCEKLTIRFANGIITTNQSILDRQHEIMGKKKEFETIIYNGPSENFESKENKELSEEFKEKKVILYIGLMAPQDCVYNIVNAGNSLINEKSIKNCHFVLLGDGPEINKLKKLVENYKIEDYFSFKGMVSHEEVMEYLYISDVCLVPDMPNGLNEYLTLIKTLEYMKAAKPFVSFDLKETKFIGGKHALYSKDFEEYVDNIEYLLKNPDISVKMGHEARERVISHFSWDFQEKKMIEFYKKIIK